MTTRDWLHLAATLTLLAAQVRWLVQAHQARTDAYAQLDAADAERAQVELGIDAEINELQRQIAIRDRRIAEQWRTIDDAIAGRDVEREDAA